jgi:glutathione synthase/RimK-type ligase-like ATP-grasp enzyme
MTAKKKVLFTVNPDLLEGKRFQTVRSMVTGLHENCDLFIVPITGYDFKRKRLNAYRRAPRGLFERHGWIKPEADLWIVYTDGYWLDATELGFKNKRDFLEAQFEMHESQAENGSVGEVINTAQAERNCLKSWFATLDAKKWGVVPTYCFSNWGEVHDYLKREKSVVAKPNWGGARSGIHKLSSEKDLNNFRKLVETAGESLKDDYCFQPLVTGPETRFWYVNGACVGGRKIFARSTPWLEREDERVIEYWKPHSREFRKALEKADKLCRKSGLTIGSIDSIGDYINEINGAGTTFTQYSKMNLITDARQPLVDYLVSLLKDK